MKREKIEWCQFYWFDTDQPELPRILLIGDSIVCGYASEVAKLLKGIATVSFFSTSKIAGDPAYSRELALALADYPPDLIYFNNGLHGFEYDEMTYASGLEQLVSFLKLTSNVPLFWRSSTPVTVSGSPEKFDPLLNPRVMERNRLAREIMKKYGIVADDLYSVVLDKPEISAGDGYHYTPDGYRLLARHIAGFLADKVQKI